jgi:hypothetical protein
VERSTRATARKAATKAVKETAKKAAAATTNVGGWRRRIASIIL